MSRYRGSVGMSAGRGVMAAASAVTRVSHDSRVTMSIDRGRPRRTTAATRLIADDAREPKPTNTPPQTRFISATPAAS